MNKHENKWTSIHVHHRVEIRVLPIVNNKLIKWHRNNNKDAEQNLEQCHWSKFYNGLLNVINIVIFYALILELLGKEVLFVGLPHSLENFFHLNLSFNNLILRWFYWLNNLRRWKSYIFLILLTDYFLIRVLAAWILIIIA